MAMKCLCMTVCLVLLFSQGVWARAQKEIPLVAKMPDRPEPLQVRDWKQTARAYDELVFDFSHEGLFLPLISWDLGQVNFKQKSFFLPSYVGDYRAQPGGQEAINLMAAVVGATLVGIDKSDQQGENWVLMLNEFYNDRNGLNLVLNNPSGSTGSFWYTVFPSMLFFMVLDLYPELGRAETLSTSGETLTMFEIAVRTAYRYLAMIESQAGFSFTGYDFMAQAPIERRGQMEADGAAGLAWLCYQAYRMLGDERFLVGAEKCLLYLTGLDTNPYYEVLLPYGVYCAALLNAEEGREIDLQTLMKWCFQSSGVRKGWGVITDRWGEYDVHGLVGSRTDGGGYAFAMNSFQMVASLLPVVRYDPRYADTLGKWALQVVNNARLFYPDELPSELQSSPEWLPFSQGAVAYEGLRKREHGKTPYATGDAMKGQWAATNYALYGSSHVGFLAGLISTWDGNVLKLDLLKTDFGGRDAYPTFLYYNATKDEMVITEPGLLYDLVTKEFYADSEVTLAPNESAVLVVLPRDKGKAYRGNTLVIDDLVVDYMANMVAFDRPHEGELVSGDLQLQLDLILQEHCLQEVVLHLDGEEIYRDRTLPQDVSIHTTLLKNGSWHKVEVEVTLQNEVRIGDTVQFQVKNSI